MSSRAAIFVILSAFGLVGVIGLAAYLILQACALPFPFLRHLTACKTDTERAAILQLDAATQRSLDLQRQIFELEREVSALQCVKGPPDPNKPLTRDGWADQDLGMFYGCWSLDHTYRTRDVDTNSIRSYTRWLMCFDAKGNGRQRMQSTDGITCEGPITAQYSGTDIKIVEPANLTCSDGGYIHQRQISCALADGGGALCDTVQSETGGQASDVGFTRSPT